MKDQRKKGAVARLAVTSIALLFGLCLFGSSAWGQATTATLTGSVTDQQGAMVPSAKIEVKNVDTNVAVTGVTSSSGIYSIPSLNPGTYTVTASAANFKTDVRKDVVLKVGDQKELDLKLQVGAATETVEVTSSAPLLETSSANLGTVIDQSQISTLPVLNDNVMTLMRLTPGFVNTGGMSPDSTVAWQNGGLSNYNVNGSDGFNAQYSLNGMPDTDRGTGISISGEGNSNEITIIPPSDSVGEFKVQTNTYDASNGRNAGGSVAISLKSGTNKWHGTLYNYMRNTMFNANLWSSKQSNLGRAPMHWNQPGGMISGPVIKDKLFFMFSAETDIEHVVGSTTLATVPTALERSGDFSQTFNADGSLVNIYDSLCDRTTPIPGNNLANDPCAGATPNNAIGKAIVSALPLPNTPTTVRGANNLTLNPVVFNLYHTYIGRADYTLDSKNMLSATYSHDNYSQTGGDQGYPIKAAAPAGQQYHWNDAATFTLTSTLKPNLVSTAILGYLRHRTSNQPEGWGFDPSSLGINGLLQKNYPSIKLSWANEGSVSIGGGNASLYTTDEYYLSESVTSVIRSHSLKYGGEFRIMQDNTNNNGNSAGNISFDDCYTRALACTPGTVDPGTSGDPTADLLLGYISSGSTSTNVEQAFSDNYAGLFIQDDWRVNSKLTLNLGLRWDIETPETERHNVGTVGFDISTPYQINGESVIGGLEYATPSHRTMYNKDFTKIQPRFGMDYKILPKLVFRGGWGEFASPTSNFQPAYGYNASTSMATSVSQAGITPLQILANPYPNGFLQPTGNSLGLLSQLGQSINFENPAHKTATTQQFSAALQYEMPFKTMLNVAYAGTRSSNHDAPGAGSYDANELPWNEYQTDGMMCVADAATGQTADPSTTVDGIAVGPCITAGNWNPANPQDEVFNQNVTNPFLGSAYYPTFGTGQYNVQQDMKPYRQFGGVSTYGYNTAHRYYDGLQIDFEKRTSAGLMMMANFVWSKTQARDWYLENGHDAINQLAKEIIPPDRSRVFNMAASYLLPFYAHSSNVLAKEVLGGWNASMTISFQSGAPVGPLGIHGPPSVVALTTKNIKIKDPKIGDGIFFNTCYLDFNGQQHDCIDNDGSSLTPAWQLLAPYQHATPPFFSASVRTPSTGFKSGINASFYKEFPVMERYKLQFRGDLYNLFNTTVFQDSPNGPPMTFAIPGIFGVIQKSEANENRVSQFTLKLMF